MIKNADWVGTQRDGATVLSFTAPFFTVKCACGKEFPANRARLVYSRNLHCRGCRSAMASRHGAKGRATQASFGRKHELLQSIAK